MDLRLLQQRQFTESDEARVEVIDCLMDPELDRGLREVGKEMAARYARMDFGAWLQARHSHKEDEVEKTYQGKVCGGFWVTMQFNKKPVGQDAHYTNVRDDQFRIYATFWKNDNANSGITFTVYDEATYSISAVNVAPYINSRNTKIYMATFLQGIDAFMQEAANQKGKVLTMLALPTPALLPELQHVGYTPVPQKSSEESTPTLSASRELIPNTHVNLGMHHKQYFPQLSDVREEVNRIVIDVL